MCKYILAACLITGCSSDKSATLVRYATPFNSYDLAVQRVTFSGSQDNMKFCIWIVDQIRMTHMEEASYWKCEKYK